MRLLRALLLSLACVGAAHGAAYVPLPGGQFDSVLPQGAVPTESASVQVAPFALRAMPVTVAEYAAFVRAHPEWQRGRAPAVLADARYLLQWSAPTEPGATLRPDAPVTEVSWFAARAFCEAEGGRLPTWLEWEYAAAADATRADARSDPAWGRRILAWYEKPGGVALAAVGGEANAFGARDLHGLVWEWVDDFNALFIAGDSRTQGDPDLLKFCGAGAINIIGRDSYAVLMRIALLSSLNAADSTSALGFRCVQPGGGQP
ncbi:formylglycine-generating enzyme family protein [Ramlibacter sp. XY19]|uniref:formylglycine-generating enzyme family protein n=1 Tax=Ramlibacter paludis TaxID=2908000 RepID=UPI0023DC7263|nr:formylglycine-generating enzyme family protein [Ramlibacter paludis]MCG2595816.1 formylglycine-generating enzyme family protein [Ramlibacter paludis]